MHLCGDLATNKHENLPPPHGAWPWPMAMRLPVPRAPPGQADNPRLLFSFFALFWRLLGTRELRLL